MESIYVTDEVKKRALQIKEMLAGNPVTNGVSVTERSFWDNVHTSVDVPELISRVEGYIAEPFPEITEEIYYEIRNNAKVRQSDKIVFTSMRRLEQAVLAECIENKGRFLEYIINGIKSICARKSWVRSGHDSAFDYCDYEGRHGLVDLYSSSIAWRLATCDYCLGDKLPEDLRNELASKVRGKVLDVFFKRLYENPETTRFNGIVPLYWLDAFDNWLSVCLAGVTGAGIYYCNDDEKALLIAVYEKMIQNYLNSLPGGDCVEGLSYWGYGFGKFVAASDMIYRATGGRVDLYKQKEFLEAAKFGYRISVCEGVYPTAADCDIKAKPSGFCMKYLSRRANLSYDYQYESVGEDIYIVMMMLNWNKNLNGSVSMENTDEKVRTYFEKRSVLISRNEKRDFGVYIQAGNNHVPHNHNDIGNFIIGMEGETFVVDPGLTQYGGITFSERRYEIEVLSSFGHSVPKVCGMLQGPEKFLSVNTNTTSKRSDDAYEEIKYFGEVVEKQFGDDSDRIVIDMKKAYECDKIVSLTREMVFDRVREEVTVTDKFEYTEENSFETAFVTLLNVDVVDRNNVEIKGKNNTMSVKYGGNDGEINFACIDGAYTNDKTTPIHPLRVAKKVYAKNGAVSMIFKKK